ncbi:hypothetical protein STEG23_027429 [Scotinomys teguina]
MCTVNRGHHGVEMGARVTRAFRNFNLENRAEREISKMKPSTAPRHPSTRSLLQEQQSQNPEIKEEVSRKDNKLLSLLKDVYVDSKDPVSSLPAKDGEPQQKRKEFRLPIGHHVDKNVTDIPKGKVSVVEALTLLHNHKLSPETWTAEKIAQEYYLELKDLFAFWSKPENRHSILLPSLSSILIASRSVFLPLVSNIALCSYSITYVQGIEPKDLAHTSQALYL